MCNSGRNRWLFSDNHACFVGEDLRFRQCICPLTTCSERNGQFGCHLSFSFVLFSLFLATVWAAAAAAYTYIVHSRANLDIEAKSKEPTISHNDFYHRLFGEDKDSDSPLLHSQFTQ